MKDRPPAEKFQDLIVWQKGHAMALLADDESVDEIGRLLGAYTATLLSSPS